MTEFKKTSLDAFTEIKPTLGKRQQKVYNAIKQLGSPSNLEIANYLQLPINQVTPRTNELVKMNKVEFAEKRQCKISKMKVMTWKITE